VHDLHVAWNTFTHIHILTISVFNFQMVPKKILDIANGGENNQINVESDYSQYR
jgi:hypothetical protein